MVQGYYRFYVGNTNVGGIVRNHSMSFDEIMKLLPCVEYNNSDEGAYMYKDDNVWFSFDEEDVTTIDYGSLYYDCELDNVVYDDSYHTYNIQFSDTFENELIPKLDADYYRHIYKFLDDCVCYIDNEEVSINDIPVEVFSAMSDYMNENY